MPQPLYVLRSKFAGGINGLTEMSEPGIEPMAPASLVDALTGTYNTDAHFVTYSVPGAAVIPRMNKPALRSVRDAGMDIVCQYIVLDYDNPAHGGWTPDTLREFMAHFELKCDDLMAQWRAFYTTRGGARIVYELSEPLPCDEAELRIAGLIARYHARTILVDNLKDWTRLFRLPNVNRDGEQQGDAWWYINVQQDNVVDVDALPSLGELGELSALKPLDASRPDSDEAKDSLWTVQGEKRVRTEWYRTAKRALNGRACFRCIFEEAPIARDGERNQTLISYTGSAVSLLHGYPDTEPELVFALFVPAVEQLDGADGSRAWIDTLWHGVKLAWEREDGRAEQAKVEAVHKERETVSGKDVLIAGVREWYPALPEDADAAWAWISGRQVLAAPSKYFVLRPDGFYHGTPCGKDMLPATIHRLGMTYLVDGFEMPIYDKDGNEVGTKTCTTAALLEDHAFAVQGVAGRANQKGGTLFTDATGQSYLQLAMYSLRDDIAAEYSADVDEWLHACFGERTLDVTNWLGHALDFRRPICALSVVGPPSMGKKILAKGLAECINTRKYADGQEMVDQYQSAIAKTPFVNINEGFPVQQFGRSAADNFRRWTSGDPITVNPKFMPTLEIQSPLRILITANNSEVVRTISLGKTLSIEDRDAIGMRLLHIVAQETAADWLRMKGGWNFTEGWIDGDDGEPGDDIVAKHFMWLYKNRPPVPDGNRFLVEGGLDSDVIQDMALESGLMPDVVETIIDLISSSTRETTPGLSVDENTGLVYILPAAVVTHHSKIARRGGRALTHRPVAQALRTLKHAAWREGNHRVVDANGRKKQARWWMLDNSMLLRAARSNGFRTDKIMALMGKEAPDGEA